MSEPVHSGRCACGRVEVTVRGALPATSICHCRACQRRTGSVYGVQFRVPEGRFASRGEVKVFTRRGEGEITFRFCPACGSTLWWTLDGLPGQVSIAVGTLAGAAEFPAPTRSVYEARKPAWVPLPDSIETHWD